jgi:hypothetical protein
MVGERLGFSRILIAGADHSWTKTLSVDNDNNVVSIQPHFYSDNKEETARVSHVYKGFHIYQILESMSIAFRSYFQIADYMKAKKINIVNITPGSFIDAFPRADFSHIIASLYLAIQERIIPTKSLILAIFSANRNIINLHLIQCPYRLLFENVTISALY